MLNLSDKDLDRLSQEAAQHHEPGDIVGPRLWEKLELRLDRDLGKISPNPARGIRRLPFYYAPAMLVLLGVSYYLVRLNNKSHKGMSSGSPPLTLIKAAPADALNPSSSSQNPEQSNKPNSTLTAPSNTVPYPGASAAAGAAITPDHLTPDHRSPAPSNIIASANTASHHRHGHNLSHSPGSVTTGLSTPGSPVSTGAPNTVTPTAGSQAAEYPTAGSPTAGSLAAPDRNTPQKSARELALSRVRGPFRLAHAASIDDSALRAIAANSIPRQPITRKGGLHINRSLEFGLLGAADFASVNSVAGEKAGSTFGLTVDYKFADRWYLGSGLLFSRKNYAAAPEDYHVPSSYYYDHGMSNVQFVTGRLDMLEIPLNLRYDFSTTGNTLFFASVGTSSYLLTSENCSYYYNLFGRIGSKEFQYSKPDYLFSAINLSMGVETGISNSLSLLIAPYVKVPTGNIGFGQVQLSSFGIDFALKFAPVISRKR
jgi:hypothetical protein